MTLRDDAAALVLRTTAAQGLPEKVSDRLVLAKIAATVRAGPSRDEGAPHHKGASGNFCCTFTTTAAAAKRGGRRVPN